VLKAIEEAAPDVLIDQLTRLPANPAELIKSLANDTRLRRDGGANLLAAAKAVGARRYIVRSRGFFLDAPQGQLADESAKLLSHAADRSFERACEGRTRVFAGALPWSQAA
jgi:hypothetical protein